ncbi:single-stranded-DNA-specific exonuclease RecJ [Candidatus Shapirobacteria bacterium CG_4_8_14_3_um_filter_39_11]|uniref:Single-stranded-DNA-specific exonuclease RecJ n=1 Tax=Candidatus Shapirobacteria bacterium CG_4_8_14_3_um_filter_39_11 TaxID=1974875 RepID=A0A2M8GIG3_9BACT|nr:MAG: single-stranded-DNA-specific exonuclease RecJ [Candidatus Shapirobacteria bacterium CG_4_8_14_3_um_filter_39_11]
MNWKILNKTQRSKEAKFQSEDVIKILLENRGLKTKSEIDEFLNPKHPICFTAKDLGIDEKELQKSVKRIKQAIKNNEAIIVYGDYDADGICATAILWESLYKLTKNVLPYIPERVSEGYGLNKKAIENCKLKIENLKLIITVDHGITANEKIKYAKELGIDVIVCDHHELGKEIPQCSAVIHTDKICAAAIAWFLAKTITNHPTPNTYLDLVAIATIADLEPLIGINRSLAKFGLEALRKTNRCGLLAIFNEARLKKEEIDTYHVGYIIAPRLNAMGRMEHALESLRLLCTNDCDKAKSLADKLGLTNKERQLLTDETLKQAKLLVAGMEGQLPKFLIVDSDQFQEGVIGLAAGKLVEEFYRPSLVISRGEIYSKASGRSISGFNIIEAIRAQADLLVDAGGHPMAAGLTVETVKIDLLRQRLMSEAERQITKGMLQKTLFIDLKLPISEISDGLWQEIQKLQPFGLGNYEPNFSSKVIVKSFRTVGNEGKHLKLTLSPSTHQLSPLFSAIGFGMGHMAGSLKVDREIEIAYSLSLNEWNNRQSIELKIKDLTE